MKADKKLYEAVEMLEQPITEVRDKVVECIDAFLEGNGIQAASVEIF